MITTKQIQATLDTDSIIREYRNGTMFWFNQDKTRWVAYGPRWGWGVNLDSLFSGKGETFKEAIIVAELTKLWDDMM